MIVQLLIGRCVGEIFWRALRAHVFNYELPNRRTEEILSSVVCSFVMLVAISAELHPLEVGLMFTIIFFCNLAIEYFTRDIR